jgi:hypothetical protein
LLFSYKDHKICKKQETIAIIMKFNSTTAVVLCAALALCCDVTGAATATASPHKHKQNKKKVRQRSTRRL